MVRVYISNFDIENIECQTMVLGFFEDERPLRGLTGLVDWKMNGLLSNMIIKGFCDGHKGEKILIATEGRLPFKKILLMGLGKTEAFDLEDLADTGKDMAETAYKIGSTQLATQVPGPESRGADYSKRVERFINGVLNWLSSFDDENRPEIDLTLMDREERFDDIMAGLYKSKSFHKNKKILSFT